MLGTIKIEYKGEQHTVRFNIAARLYLLEKLKASNDKISEALQSLGTFGVLRTITHAGIVGWAEQNMEDPTMSEKEVAQYLADAPDEKVAEIFKEFNTWFLGITSDEEKKSPEQVPKKKKN